MWGVKDHRLKKEELTFHFTRHPYHVPRYVYVQLGQDTWWTRQPLHESISTIITPWHADQEVDLYVLS